ncbi:MAG: AMP-binding protein [Verrucomicrobiota bacterium]
MPNDESEPTIPSDLIYEGHEALPGEPILLIPNRLIREDIEAISAILSGREWVFVVETGSTIDPPIADLLNTSDLEKLEFSLDAKDAEKEQFLDSAATALNNGKSLFFVPSRASALRAALSRTKPEVVRFLAQLDLPIAPLYIERPAEIALAVEKEGGHCRTVFVFGDVVGVNARRRFQSYQQSLIEARELAFTRDPVLESSLAFLLLKGLLQHSGHTRVVDGLDGSELGFEKILAAALALASYLKKETNKGRVGIVLPPGKGGLIANLGVLFAGKVPVNLNFTASTEAINSAIRQSELDRIISADKFISKTPRFPWPPSREVILLERLIPKIKKSAIFWGVMSKILPAPALAAAAGISRKGGDREAVLLFTSGSSGEPKGVPLTHRNLVANVKQFGTPLEVNENRSILGCLPLFHSLGCTVTLWFPIIEGFNLITYPSPLETGTLAELIEKHQVVLMLATPTFLRGYLRKAKPEQLTSVQLPIVGAEKLPKAVAESFKNRFGTNVLEGYGLTETSPVTNVNLPDPEAAGDDIRVVPSYRLGSVGQMLPGVAVRITDPSSGGQIPLDQSGMIWFKAANVFPGYLKMPRKTEEVIKDGWFCTGDIGRVDEDGFLYIEGRLSRFSKIGGEMVPHEKVEQSINSVLGSGDDESVRKFAIVGVPDEKKGEALVLITTEPMSDQAMIELRYELLEKEIPALWIPRKSAYVDEIPVLSSGKLDIQGCVEIALSRSKSE